MNTTAGVPVSYAARLPGKSRTRLRAGLVLAVLLTVAVSSFAWGPAAWHRARLSYHLYQCRNYHRTADRVAYDDDPARAAVLLDAGAGYAASPHPWRSGASVAAYSPRCWSALLDVSGIPAGPRSAVLFLGERQASNGPLRLVAVCRRAPVHENGLSTFPFFVTVLDPAALGSGAAASRHSALFHGGKTVVLPPGRPRPYVRYFAGQPDPNDPSHFTIRYEVNGQHGIIDGFLVEQGNRVELRGGNGPIMY